MKTHTLLILFYLISSIAAKDDISKTIFRNNRKAVCLVSFYQNIASDARIGSFNKIKKYRTGIVVSPGGLIMVSNDVYPVSLDIISGNNSYLSALPTEFTVKLADGKEYTADFLGKDDQAQVAFIRINNRMVDDELPYIKFAGSESLDVTEDVFVLELLPKNYNFAPLFTQHTINALVESPRRKFLINNFTTALSACAPVFDSEGRAIGISLKQVFDFSFRPPEEFEEFQKDYLEIAPSEWFKELIANPPKLKEKQYSQKSWLGIRMQGLSKELQAFWGVSQDGGIVVNQIYPESPAENNGIKSGDVILAVNDSTLLVRKDEETSRLRAIIRAIPPGEVIRVKIFRQGKILSRKVELSAAPKSIALAEKFSVTELGFEIRELTRDILYQENLPLSTEGVFVYQVDRASPAGLGGLNTGNIMQEINGKTVKDLEEAKAVIEKLIEDNKKKIMLRILENRSTRFVFVDLKK